MIINRAKLEKLADDSLELHKAITLTLKQFDNLTKPKEKLIIERVKRSKKSKRYKLGTHWTQKSENRAKLMKMVRKSTLSHKRNKNERIKRISTFVKR